MKLEEEKDTRAQVGEPRTQSRDCSWMGNPLAESQVSHESFPRQEGDKDWEKSLQQMETQ